MPHHCDDHPCAFRNTGTLTAQSQTQTTAKLFCRWVKGNGCWYKWQQAEHTIKETPRRRSCFMAFTFNAPSHSLIFKQKSQLLTGETITKPELFFLEAHCMGLSNARHMTAINPRVSTCTLSACVLPSLLSFHPTCSYVYHAAWTTRPRGQHRGRPIGETCAFITSREHMQAVSGNKTHIPL